MSPSRPRPAQDRAGLPAARVQLVLGLSIALGSLLPGCGRVEPPATVEGRLQLDGQPLDNCLVVFLPEPSRGAVGPRACALTDGNGGFRLRGDDQQDGATTGWHRVTVQDVSASSGIMRRDHGTVDEQLDENAPPPPVRPSRVPLRYMSPDQTPLRRQIREGHQVIDIDIPSDDPDPQPRDEEWDNYRCGPYSTAIQPVRGP